MSSVRYDEKGKFFTKVVSKTEVPALIQTFTHLIRGSVHVRLDERIKDELDRSEPFLAVTGAVVYASDGEVLYESDFISINRNQIVWLIPVNDETERTGDNE